jgi:hypothetical protein
VERQEQAAQAALDQVAVEQVDTELLRDYR